MKKTIDSLLNEEICNTFNNCLNLKTTDFNDLLMNYNHKKFGYLVEFDSTIIFSFLIKDLDFNSEGKLSRSYDLDLNREDKKALLRELKKINGYIKSFEVSDAK